MLRYIQESFRGFHRQYIHELDRIPLKYDIIQVHHHEHGHGYYTIDNSLMKYDLNFAIGDVFALKQKGLGPENCPLCYRYGSLRGVIVGLCSSCAQLYYGNNCCRCQMSNEFVEKLVENQGCDQRFCEIERYILIAPIEKIGCEEFWNICDSSTRSNSTSTTVTAGSLHNVFIDDTEVIESNSSSENTEFPRVLSLKHPDECTYEPDKPMCLNFSTPIIKKESEKTFHKIKSN